jgi:nucleoside-diphosphate-sugar epimerase
VLLVIGCGDVGLRVLRALRGRLRVIALTSQPARVPALRAAGAVPLVGDLDDATTLGRLGGLADFVLHLAPPPAAGRSDPRTRVLLNALARGARVQALVYASTTGVYGDCGGALVAETRALAPATDRAHRRVDAERRLRWFARAFGVRVALLRVPGIYALDREGGDPRERVARGTPLLRAEDDVHTNHVHADDLARLLIAALFRAAPLRAFNVGDDGVLPMGEHYELVADLAGLPRPPRLARAEAARALSPMQMSFLAESRRLDNGRRRRELRVPLRYPTVAEALAAATDLTRPAAGAASSRGPRPAA